jgi:hypothetical protein
MPRNPNTDTDRDNEGHFAGGNDQNAQSRGQNDFGSDNRSSGQHNQATSSQHRDWSEDDHRTAQGGGSRYGNGGNASRDDRDDDEDDLNYRQSGQQNRNQGNYGTQSGQPHDEADFGAWHAYGHNRGWHGYQRRDTQANAGAYGDNNQNRARSQTGNPNRNTVNAGQYDDNNRNNRGGNR